MWSSYSQKFPSFISLTIVVLLDTLWSFSAVTETVGSSTPVKGGSTALLTIVRKTKAESKDDTVELWQSRIASLRHGRCVLYSTYAYLCFSPSNRDPEHPDANRNSI